MAHTWTADLSQPQPAARPALEPLWWRISNGLLVASAYLYRFVQTEMDPDLWGHVRFGLDALRARSIVRSDPYSYLTAGVTWINHEVLAELAMGWAYSLCGALGLNLLRLAIGAITLAVIAWHLRRRGSTTVITASLVVIAMFGMQGHLMQMRPQIFTLLYFILTIVVLQEAEERGPRMLWWLVPIFWLWINTHGGILAGLGVVAIWAIIRLFQIGVQREVPFSHRLRAGLHLVIPLLGSLAATWITPYGPGLLAFLLRTATVPRPEILDWQPLQLSTGPGLAYLICLAVTLAGVHLSRRPRSAPQMGIFAIMALTPFLAVRHIPLFAGAAVLIAGEHVNDMWERWRSAHILRPGQTSRLFQYVVIGSAVGLAVASVALSIPKITFISIRAGKNPYPIRAVMLIRQNVPEGNLAVHFNWGEYAIWHLGPAVKVSMDGRRETVYPEEVYQMNIRFMTGQGEWDTLLEQYPTDMALVRKVDATYNLLRCKPGWVLVYEDDISALFVRQDFRYRRALEEAATRIAEEAVSLRFP